MAFTMEDYANIQSSEAKYRRFVEATVEELIRRPHVAVDLLKRAPSKEVNTLMRQFPVHLWDNPNIGRSTSREAFRSPGSPAYGAFYFGPVGAHISGGLDGDTLDNERASGMNAGDSVAMRMSRDMEVFWNDLEAGVFHGNTGERAVVSDVAAAPITVSGGISTVTFDTEWGVKHVNPGNYYQFFSGTTEKGILTTGAKCLDKNPGARTARFVGDLTAATLAGNAIPTGAVMVGLNTFNKDLDGFPEFLGTTGWYGGLKRDDLFQTQGLQVDGGSKNISIGILEKADTRQNNASAGQSRPGDRVDITTWTQESSLNAIGWAAVVYSDQMTINLGFTSVKYKGRTRILTRDCSILDFWQLNLSKVCHLMLHEFQVMPSYRAEGNIFQRISTSTGMAMDMYYWIFFGKGQRATSNPRLSLLLTNLGTTNLDTGDVF